MFLFNKNAFGTLLLNCVKEIIFVNLCAINLLNHTGQHIDKPSATKCVKDKTSLTDRRIKRGISFWVVNISLQVFILWQNGYLAQGIPYALQCLWDAAFSLFWAIPYNNTDYCQIISRLQSMNEKSLNQSECSWGGTLGHVHEVWGDLLQQLP